MSLCRCSVKYKYDSLLVIFAENLLQHVFLLILVISVVRDSLCSYVVMSVTLYLVTCFQLRK